MKAPLAALLAALILGSAAQAQEIIQAGPRGAPPESRAGAGPLAPAADPEQSPQAIGAWARGVMANAANPHATGPDQAVAAPGQRPSACTPPPDRKPHGEVWVGASSHGYREGGAALTAPLGDCGQATIVIDQTRAPHWRGR